MPDFGSYSYNAEKMKQAKAKYAHITAYNKRMKLIYKYVRK